MPVRYDIYETPDPEGNEEAPRFHVRIVNKGTVTTDKLAEEISFSSSLTQGDIVGLLPLLSHYLVEHFSKGERVHIEGLGYFQLAITAPTVTDGKKMRADHIKVKGINFQPEKKMMAKLKSIKFARIEEPFHARKLTDEDVDYLLEEYFKDHNYITRFQFEMICGFKKSTAIRRIKKLVQEGKLKIGGIKGAPVYEKV